MIDGKLLLRDQPFDFVVQRTDTLDEVFRSFLEREEDPGFVEFDGAVIKISNSKQGLAPPSRAA